jgi:hypothetical protein
MKTRIFQMVGSTRSTSNGFGDSSGRNQPPSPPDPTIVATQTEMMHQILLILQQQSQQQQPHGNQTNAQGQVTEYKHFLDMNPPQFNGTEEPLDADAWIRAIEAMFAVFTLPCSEGRKAKFAALQLRGSALMWWEHYKSMQQPEYEITWEEFKKVFKDHHLPKALTDRKMRELLALKLGSDTVYQYAQKFNNLCQYGGYHVDTDMKKMELFREGLNSKLAEWLNLVKFDSYPMLVNKAISQEDAMKRAQAEKKRKADSMPNNAQRYKIRIMRKTFPDFQQASQSERLVAKLSQDRTQENLHLPNTQQPTPQPIVP